MVNGKKKPTRATALALRKKTFRRQQIPLRRNRRDRVPTVGVDIE